MENIRSRQKPSTMTSSWHLGLEQPSVGLSVLFLLGQSPHGGKELVGHTSPAKDG